MGTAPDDVGDIGVGKWVVHRGVPQAYEMGGGRCAGWRKRHKSRAGAADRGGAGRWVVRRVVLAVMKAGRWVVCRVVPESEQLGDGWWFMCGGRWNALRRGCRLRRPGFLTGQG